MASTARVIEPPVASHALAHLGHADLAHAVPLMDRVWWVGHVVDGDPFQCHVYLIEQGDQSVLLDLGSGPSFPFVKAKVEEVVPLSHVRWFVCHHQDPDVCGALATLDKDEDLHEDAAVVTHWRAESIIRHYGTGLPFWAVDQHGWRLELADRVLRFVLTPYLHFPGAFVTFDESSGVLFSSDLFGGFTGAPTLLVDSMEYFEAMRLFHEHYMPSREILQHGLSRLEKLPIRAIAPQHGSIIPEAFVQPLTDELSRLECGLYRFVESQDEVKRQIKMNRVLREAQRALVVNRDFPQLMKELTAAVALGLPVTKIELFAKARDGALRFSEDNHFQGEPSGMPSSFMRWEQEPRSSWHPERGLAFGPRGESLIVLPLYTASHEVPQAMAQLHLSGFIDVGEITQRVLRTIAEPLAVAIERQILLREIEEERARFHRLSVFDALTGLCNRYALREAARSLFAMHEREQVAEVGVSMFDLDHFKQINDTFGHAMGDTVLTEFAEIMRQCSRAGDQLFRIGGEELVSLHAFEGAAQGAVALAERIREALAGHDFGPELGGHPITVSVGVVRLRRGETLDGVLARADRALYAAKSQGRNRVVFED